MTRARTAVKTSLDTKFVERGEDQDHNLVTDFSRSAVACPGLLPLVDTSRLSNCVSYLPSFGSRVLVSLSSRNDLE